MRMVYVEQDTNGKLQLKLQSLKEIVVKMESMLVAYSGGVDSTLLLKIGQEVLADKVLAVTAFSPTYPQRELSQAKRNAATLGVRHLVIETNELDNADFAVNSPARCYFCKSELFAKLVQLARQYQLNYVADGSNYDDSNDFRPGNKVLAELDIRSPLKEAKLKKSEIRILSKQIGLTTWDKPSFACLASRFAYGSKITKRGLSRVEQAEELLGQFGIKQFRVRVHGNLARIEVNKEDIPLVIGEDVSRKIVTGLKDLGYTYITLDLQGYRMGSMNEALERRGRCGQK